MTNSDYPTMETLFRNLDRWRHFAGFPLEARVDAIIGIFLPHAIERHLKDKRSEVVEMHPQVVPQFPLKKPHNFQSDKVDFFTATKDAGRGFLVEIKTDMRSFRPSQSEYLSRAKENGLQGILCDFKGIVEAGKGRRRKYFHLIQALSDMGLLGLPDKLKELIAAAEPNNSTVHVRKIDLNCSAESTLEVVFIQPSQTAKDGQSGFLHIYFDEFADSVQNDGKLGSVVAHYLKQWVIRAGDRPAVERLLL